MKRIVCAGGIAEKNPLLMQIYADVTGREMQIARSSQACALGSAMAAAVVAGVERGGHADFATAQKAMAGIKAETFAPIARNKAVYDGLFELYAQLHDAFGGVRQVELGALMKKLLAIREASA